MLEGQSGPLGTELYFFAYCFLFSITPLTVLVVVINNNKCLELPKKVGSKEIKGLLCPVSNNNF